MRKACIEMDYQEFYAQLKQGTPGRVYLFEGEEEYGKDSALKALRAALLKGPMALMNESVLQNPDADELIRTCETLPVMEARRLVVVRESAMLAGKAGKAEESADDGEEDPPEQRAATPSGDAAAAAYLPGVPDTTCIVFFVRGKANASRRLYRKIREMGGVVSFDALDGERLVKWIAREFAAYGKQVDRQTAEYLVFACGRELLALKNEAAKIAAHAGDGSTIRKADVDAVANFTAEYRVFDLADKVSSGNAGEAVRLMKTMLDGDEPRLMLLSLLQRHYRMLLLTRILLDGRQSQARVMEELGVPGFVARRLTDVARAYTPDALKEAYLQCVRQEFLIKSGRLGEEGSLEALVFHLLNVRKEAAGRA
ncbi:MAG TPA: DNA polymerase III subunit delta [Candidatus Limnocylindria bacterium]|nr:DNA polymerase III subunit delta [Candidatus Limnocylindria bacterium]